MDFKPLNEIEIGSIIEIIVTQCYRMLYGPCFNGEVFTQSHAERLKILDECLDTIDVSKIPDLSTEDHVIAEQVDAAVDIWVYTLNAFCKKGMVVSNPYMHDYMNVMEFTVGAGQNCLDDPELMNDDETKFLIRMILSECQELVASIKKGPEFIRTIKENIDFWPLLDGKEVEKGDLFKSQVKSGEIIWQFFMDMFEEKGISVHDVFAEVHKANMAKRDPSTGKFILRKSDGKIMKPEGWKAPNIFKVIQIQRMKYE